MFATTTYFPAGTSASVSTVVGGPVGIANSFARSTLKASLSPGGPCAPIGPGGPAAPGRPCAPVTPGGPCAPEGPTGPCAPGRPCGPVWFHQTSDEFPGQPSSLETSLTPPLKLLTQAWKTPSSSGIPVR